MRTVLSININNWSSTDRSGCLQPWRERWQRRVPLRSLDISLQFLCIEGRFLAIASNGNLRRACQRSFALRQAIDDIILVLGDKALHGFPTTEVGWVLSLTMRAEVNIRAIVSAWKKCDSKEECTYAAWNL